MIKLLILCGLVLIVLGTPCHALPAATPDGAIYYVVPSGNDNDPGTIAYPWQTIQKATNTLTASDRGVKNLFWRCTMSRSEAAYAG